MSRFILFYILLFFCVNNSNSEDFFSNTKIVGGSPADINQFPYQIYFHITTGPSSYSFCGGSIISLRHILTAAHCVCSFSKTGVPIVTNPANIRILAGTADSKNVQGLGQNRRVQQIFYHNGWTYMTNFDNDVAILTLIKPFVQGPSVKPIDMNTNSLDYPQNTSCVVSGWGTIQSGGAISQNLLKVVVSISNITKCREGYGSQLTDNMLCAGDENGNKDACQGDSGGPLVCQSLLGGIVSFGTGCGEKSYPGVYTKVSKYISWISNKTSEKYCDFMDVGSAQIIASPFNIYSYQVTVLRMYNTKYVPYCTGIIVSMKNVVIPAHCLYTQLDDGTMKGINITDIRIMESNSTIYHTVANATIHKDYEWLIRKNDIAVLQVTNKFSANLRKISLKNTTISNTDRCVIIGRAPTNAQCGFTNDTKSIDVKIINETQCNKNYENNLYSLNDKVCAETTNLCQGDAISALVCNDQLAGLYSFSFGCSEPNYPGVYTKINSYVPWINNFISSSATKIQNNIFYYVLVMFFTMICLNIFQYKL